MYTRRFAIYLSVLLMTIAIVQCSPTSSTPPTIQTGQTETNVPVEEELTNVTPTSAPVPGISRLSNRCVETFASIPQGIILKGVLVLDSPGSNNETYLWDLSSGDQEAIGSIYIWGLAVSPDQSMLAFNDNDPDALKVIDIAGEPLYVIDEPRGYLAGWLNNENLVLNLPKGDMDGTYTPDAISVVNLTSNEYHDFLPEYPNLNDFPHEVYWRGYEFSRMVVNPQLTYLLYPAKEPPEANPLIIWDIQANKEAGRIHQFGVYVGLFAGKPLWSSDGTSFVTSAQLRYTVGNPFASDPVHALRYANEEAENAYINLDDEFPYVGGFELIRVTVEGDVERLSYLTTKYIALQSEWTWSPDSTRIAFWLTIVDDEAPVNRELAVLEVESGEVTNYCISGYSTPIWSPDGSQIAINQNPEGPYTYKIVDLTEGVAFSIAGEEEVNIGGWMISSP